jgi:hypothetical protein
MTAIEGGLRARLIRDSFEELVRETLQARGWFDSGRAHLPINLLSAPAAWDQPIEYNSLAVVVEDVTDEEGELGSNLMIDSWTAYADFFAENEQVGIHLIHDIRDSLRGKIPSIGRTGAIMPVYDFTLATPVVAFYCNIENVITDRAVGFPQPWMQFMYSARAILVDENDVGA